MPETERGLLFGEFVEKKSGVAGYFKIEGKEREYWYATNECSAHPFAAAACQADGQPPLPLRAVETGNTASNVLWTPLPFSDRYLRGDVFSEEKPAAEEARKLAAQHKNIYAGRLEPLVETDDTYFCYMYNNARYDNIFNRSF